MILSLIRKDPDREAADALFAAVSAQSRQPDFYTALGVEDSVEGRFELLILHAYLVLRRLKAAGGEADKISQRLTDALFANLDGALREMGVGDLSVSKKIRRMAEAFSGRIGAYEKGMAADAVEQDLAAALSRNVYDRADAPMAASLADYLRRADRDLAVQPMARIRTGIISFPPVATGPS